MSGGGAAGASCAIADPPSPTASNKARATRVSRSKWRKARGTTACAASRPNELRPGSAAAARFAPQRRAGRVRRVAEPGIAIALSERRRRRFMSGATADPRAAEYMQAIRQRVCAVCLDSRDDNTCSLTGRICAVEAHLPRLVAALSSVQSTRMDEYAAAIRAQVCSSCEHEDASGRCELRDAAECALQSYLSLVLDAVEEVNERRARQSAASS
jgi:hypothetical protein